ncbi:MAG: 4a-hydroxytetrahydrobiopterin dehydratase [Anaerolineaceae bacterium]|nr:4a-hydroxytetrahydrobiopterin dehydratase [Anaerolineaceae bacterium]
MPTPALNDDEIQQRLARLTGWQREGDNIVKNYRTDTYLAGIALATAIGVISEGLDHHPELTIGWRRLRVSYCTHDAGNRLSHKDFDAAERVDALGYPPGS